MDEKQKFIVLLCIQFMDFFPKSFFVTGFQENTFASNSSTISCVGNTTIAIVDLNREQFTTSCTEYKQCNLTEEQENIIKKHCNKAKSCTVSAPIHKRCLFDDDGHASVSYSCTEIVNNSCTFENDDCGWRVSGYERYKWAIRSGKSPESSTGPNRDHTTASASGYYAYTESRIGSNSNDESDFFTGLIVPSPKQCLTFWYHMFGKHINTLKVFQYNSEYNIKLWSKSENQRNKWYFQSLLLKDLGPYRIKFKAFRGDGKKSEIAIDSIFITNTACKKDSGFICNFEADSYKWNTELTPAWTITFGSSPSYYTGPNFDHTSGLSGGHYIYLASKDIQTGRKSKLYSTTINPDGHVCLTFWYHMHGNSTGTLNVYIKSGNTNQMQWSQYGNQGNSWQYAYFDISKAEPYVIIFEGVLKDDYMSYIALDDITLVTRSCSGSIKYSQTCLNTNKPISLLECSKYYLQLDKTELSFDPKVDDCSTVYQEVKTSMKSKCHDTYNSDICTFNLSEVIKKDPRCYQSNRLLIEYQCDDREKNKLSDDTQQKNASPNKGLVVGLVVAIVLLVCVAVLIFCFIRRPVVCRVTKESKKNANDKDSNVGNQCTTLPIDKEGITIVKYRDTHGVNQLSVNDDYDIENQMTETRFIQEPKQKTDPKKSYKVLDNKEKGFEGSKSYELVCSSSSKNKQQLKTKHDDIYCSSEEGTYDISGCNRHKEADGNIYSHTVDDVYDSTTHKLKRNDDDQEDKYYHFVGQKTEDLYDTSMQT
ncbi:MAM and LDL-receptor class A domain-containing protein 1-like [Mytilus californianus]|uniref:MAM and LDL-receptor class A domain-containing protein 1-like n=1 Tax=Mytilus californianus TaxID=6549 RepID=UPI0022480856|nr:MAM and LDL-receptor class A domain-containing protein 1-like [Mytilus californianus]